MESEREGVREGERERERGGESERRGGEAIRQLSHSEFTKNYISNHRWEGKSTL